MNRFKPTIDSGINSFLDPSYQPYEIVSLPTDEIETLLCGYMKTLHNCSLCKTEIHLGGSSYDCNHQLCLECIYKILSIPDNYTPICPVITRNASCNASLLRIKYRTYVPAIPSKTNKAAETAIYGKWMNLNRLSSVTSKDIIDTIARRPKSATITTTNSVTEVMNITGNPEVDLTEEEYDELIDNKISQSLEEFTYMVPKAYMNNLSTLMSHRDELLLRFHPYNLLGGDATLADVNLCIMMVSKAKAGLINAIGFDANIKEWIQRLTKKDQVSLVFGLVRTTYEYKRRIFNVFDELKASGFPDKFDKNVLEKVVRKNMGAWCVSGEIELAINSINLARKVEIDDIELYGEQTIEDFFESKKIDSFIQRRKKGQGLPADKKEILKDMQHLMKSPEVLAQKSPIVVNNDECQIEEE